MNPHKIFLKTSGLSPSVECETKKIGLFVVGPEHAGKSSWVNSSIAFFKGRYDRQNHAPVSGCSGEKSSHRQPKTTIIKDYIIDNNIIIEDSPGLNPDIEDFEKNFALLQSRVENLIDESKKKKSADKDTALIFCFSHAQLSDGRYNRLLEWIRSIPAEPIDRFYVITHFDTIKSEAEKNSIKSLAELKFNTGQEDIAFISNIKNESDLEDQNKIQLLKDLWISILKSFHNLDINNEEEITAMEERIEIDRKQKDRNARFSKILV